MHSSSPDSLSIKTSCRTALESVQTGPNSSKGNGIGPFGPPLSQSESLDSMPEHKSQLSEFPCPQVGESEKTAQWFNAYMQNVSVASFLQIACDARGGSHTCEFGERLVGGFNVAIILRFSDREEWILKTPK